MSTDPRVIRTNQLIRVAFSELLYEKEFEKITIQDISERATINRATFYSHYQDKFELMESLITANIKEGFLSHLSTFHELDHDTLQEIFLILANFYVTNVLQKNYKCRNSYDLFKGYTEEQLKQEMTLFFLQLFKNNRQESPKNESELTVAATLFSWGFYGIISGLSLDTTEARRTELFEDLYSFLKTLEL